MTAADLMTLAEEERAELLALLRGLTAEQWEAPSLCARWSVREVATHIVSYEELTTASLVATFLRGGLRVGAVNDVALRRYATLGPEDVIDLVARNLRPHGLTSAFRGGIALTDGTIHQQDIRRALGLPRTIAPNRLVQALGFSLKAPTLPARRNAKGLTLTATDLDWATGDGPKVSGPGEALLMALAGRPVALDDLAGPGLETMRGRVT